MFQRRSGALTGALIAIGLVLALWRMHAAEEQVVFSHHVGLIRLLEKKPLSNREPQSTNVAVETQPVVIKPKLKEIQQILDSKNDNDPRLDTDFKILTDGEKKAFEEKYLAYAPERFNERGTLVFLIGRNISTQEDLIFLNQVLSESPCQSLNKCSEKSLPATGEAAHTESANLVTLAYPQIVSIKSLENFLSEKNDGAPQLRTLALQTLTDATHSKSNVVADLANLTLKRISP